MATGSISVTITLPSLNGAGGSPANTLGASAAIARELIQQVGQQIHASHTASGTIYFPAGVSVGTWTFTAAT